MDLDTLISHLSRLRGEHGNLPVTRGFPDNDFSVDLPASSIDVIEPPGKPKQVIFEPAILGPVEEEPKPVKIGVGSKLWHKRDWHSFTIVGETSRSWLVRGDNWREATPDEKVPKKELPDEWFADEQKWKDWSFANQFRYEIANAIKETGGDKLREVCKVIGWMPEHGRLEASFIKD